MGTRSKYKTRKVVAASGATTLSRDQNVNGLATAITLCAELAVDYAAHVADYGASAGEHKALHTAGQLTAVAPTALASILTFTNDITAKYALHNTDAAAGSPTYHMAQDTNRALAAETTVTTLAGALTRLNDVKAKFNLHQAQTTSHRTGNLYPIAAADVALGVEADVIDTNVLAGDLVTGAMLDDGTGNVTAVSFTAKNGAVRFKASADPQDAVISYMVARNK